MRINEKESNQKRLGINAITSYGRYLVSFLVAFLLVPEIIQLSGKAEFGLFSLVFSVLGVVGLLDLGLAAAVVKSVAHCRGTDDTQLRNETISTLMVVYLILAAVATAVVGILILSLDLWMHVDNSQLLMAQKLIWILALRAVILQLPLGLFRGVLFGDQQIGLVNLVSVLSNLTYGTLAYSFLHQQAGVTGVAWASLIAMVLEHLFYMVLVYVRVPGFVLSRQLFRMERLTTLFNFSWHQFVCDAASLVLLHLDLILVQLLAGLEAVAIYAVALRLTTQGYLFSKQFVNTLSPMFAELKGREEVASIRSTFSRGTHIAIAPALALLTLAIIFGQSGLSLWLGPGFHEAWPILILLLLATAVGLPVSVAGSLLANTGHHRSLSLASAISIAANFCLSIVGFHFLGLIGIALGTLLTKVLVEHPLITVKACQIYQISPIKLLHSVITTQAWPLSLMIVTVLALDAMIGQSSLLRITLISLCGTVVYFYLLKSRSQKSTEPQIVGSS